VLLPNLSHLAVKYWGGDHRDDGHGELQEMLEACGGTIMDIDQNVIDRPERQRA